nr:hypothetical protein [Tanacetum cinerariifolium]
DGKDDEGFLVGYSVSRNQPNSSAGIQENLAACKVRKETESDQQYVFLPLWSTDFSSNSTNRVNAASTPVTVVGQNSPNSTNSFNAAGPSDNAVSPNFEIGGKSSFVDPS